VKAHCLPFSQIPHTTRLFTDFLSYSPAVQSFYPQSPSLNDWLTKEAKSISYDSSRHERISDILERQNKAWQASERTFANIDRLRKGAAAIVTGQQVGLFGGPMFTIYKALTAVKLAEESTRAGVDAVPIFWLATYDHDLAEINHVSIPGSDGAVQCSWAMKCCPWSTMLPRSWVRPRPLRSCAILTVRGKLSAPRLHGCSRSSSRTGA